MLSETEIKKLMASTGDYLASVCHDDRPATVTLTEENARKVGEAYGFGDKAAGRLIFALATYCLEHHFEELMQRREALLERFLVGPRGTIQ